MSEIKDENVSVEATTQPEKENKKTSSMPRYSEVIANNIIGVDSKTVLLMGLQNTVADAIKASPAGLAEKLCVVYEEKGLKDFINSKPVSFIHEYGLVESVAAMNRLERLKIPLYRNRFIEQTTACEVMLFPEIIRVLNIIKDLTSACSNFFHQPSEQNQYRVSMDTLEDRIKFFFSDYFVEELNFIKSSKFFEILYHLREPEVYPMPQFFGCEKYPLLTPLSGIGEPTQNHKD